MTALTTTLRTLHMLRASEPATARTATGNLPTITRRLALLALVTVLPVLAFSVFIIVRYAQVQRTQYEQQIQATAHATSLAIDVELSRRLTILITLRNSHELKERDWRAFYDLAKAAVADEPNSRANVFDRSGQLVLSTILPYGTLLPVTAAPEAINKVVETRQAYVSDLFTGSVSNEFLVAVYVPVIENGAVVYVLNFGSSLSFISRILHDQVSTLGGTGSVVDRKGIVLARTTREKEYIGRPGVPEYLRAIQQHNEGFYENRNLDGVSARGAFTKSTLSGWTTARGIDNAALNAPLRRALWVFGGGGGFLFTIALLMAIYLGRRMVAPLAALTAMAEALGRGDRLPQVRLGLHEAQIVADQMVQAGEKLHLHSIEHANLLARLADGNERLESANHELESFAYSVSHDLRAPLRAIDGFSHVLQEDYAGKLDPEAQRVIQVIRDGVGKMARLIDDILAFSRASRRELAASDIDMTGLVQATLGDLAPAMAGRKIEVKAAPLPQTHGDREMMQRVWMNLLDNAIKFTGHREHALIEIGSYPEAGNTIYFVKDNGAGFDMAYVDKLFGVFQRLHTPEEFPGTGAGLAIVKRIVGRHGGRVWAEGKVGEGAAVYFALPSPEPAHG